MPKPVTVTVLTSILLAATTSMIAVATPTANRQGDYTNDKRGSFHQYWEVVDADTKGLNCRMAKQFQGIPADGMEGAVDTFYRSRPNISAWTVVHKFPPRQKIEALSGNLANQLILLDNANSPWLAVRFIRGGKGMDCFVRANTRFIKPIK